MFFDNHTHSNFSTDSKTEIRDSIIEAYTKGISGISITDHLDIDSPSSHYEFIFDPKEQQKTVDKEFKAFKEDLKSGKINYNHNNNFQVFKGIEIGLQIGSIGKIKEYLKDSSFDVVIASVHYIDRLDPYMQTYYTGKNYWEAYSRALETIYVTAVEYGDFDILGHYDYISRYHDYPCRTITLSEFGDYLEPILKFLAQNGKALEINTNTLRERFNGTPTIDTNIIKRFKELGGEFISLGSDAHTTDRLGENFKFCADLIKRCGFQRLVYFKDRKPQLYDI